MDAGSVRRVVFVALQTSIDALTATEQVAMPDLERLHETLYALEGLTYFQKNMAEVCNVPSAMNRLILHEKSYKVLPLEMLWMLAWREILHDQPAALLSKVLVETTLQDSFLGCCAGHRLQLPVLQPRDAGCCTGGGLCAPRGGPAAALPAGRILGRTQPLEHISRQPWLLS